MKPTKTIRKSPERENHLRRLQKLIEKGEKAVPALIDAMGPCLSVAEAANLLHFSPGKVRRKMSANKILWFKDRATNVSRLPKVQFVRGHVAEWVTDVTAVAGNGRSAILFLAKKRRSTGGRSLVQLLHDGDPCAVPMIRETIKRITSSEFW
jgi:hypothetical protein